MMIEDPTDLYFALNELRVLVFMEADDRSGFRQVLLNREQFKRVSEAIVREQCPDSPDGDRVEHVHVEMSEELVPNETFEGMSSVEEES